MLIAGPIITRSTKAPCNRALRAGFQPFIHRMAWGVTLQIYIPLFPEASFHSTKFKTHHPQLKPQSLPNPIPRCKNHRLAPGYHNVCSCWATKPPLLPVKVQPSASVSAMVDRVEMKVSIATTEFFLKRVVLYRSQ
jgi:hypothetical protein